MRYYQIAGITMQVDSDLPMTDTTFSRKFELFRVDSPGDDLVRIHHHFSLSETGLENLGKPIYHKAPWAIYQRPEGWTYVGIPPEGVDAPISKVATFSHDHSVGHIYHPNADIFVRGKLGSLTTFPSDQILVARLLADRNGCYLHAAGTILNGAGMLFCGASESGKSTITRILQKAGSGRTGRPPLSVEILCDDRNILRRVKHGLKDHPSWRVHGTWSHGDVPDVSPASAPLRAIFFLEQAGENKLTPLADRHEIMHRLLACIIRPLTTADWWYRTLGQLGQIAHEVPCCVMSFVKSDAIIEELASPALWPR